MKAKIENKTLINVYNPFIYIFYLNDVIIITLINNYKSKILNNY